MIRRQYIFIVLLALCTIITKAQVKEFGLPNITNYKKSDYRGGTQNWDIDQDSNGNLYYANKNGLLQFDGIEWRTYRIPNSLEVRSVKVDKSSGRIYIGGYNEFGYFETDTNGELVYKSLSDLLKDTNRDLSDFIWKIHIYNDEIVFQSFLKAYILKNGKISLLNAPNRFQFSFVVKGSLYFQDVTAGILEYKNKGLQPLKGTMVLNNSEVWGMFAMNGDKLLIATLEKGLFTYQDGKVEPWKTEANTFIEKNGSLGGTSIKKNFFVLNSVLDGMILCDSNGRILQHINLEKGLQNNTVLTSFIDAKNNLWLGLDNGISFVNENSPFSFFNSSYNLSSVYASVVYDGFLYAATNQGVFYHPLNSSFLDDNFSLVEGTTAQSWNIQVIGNQLVCANNNGALVIRGNKIVKNLDKQGYFVFKEVPDRPNFVIGANYSGFSLFEKSEKGLEFKTIIKGIDKSSNFFEMDNRLLWLYRDRHLYKLELAKDLRSIESVDTIVKLPITGYNINSLEKIGKRVFFEGQNHFYTYLKEENEFKEDDQLSKLFSKCPSINYLKEDAYGNLWYKSGESLGAFLKDNKGNYKNLQMVFSNLSGYLVDNYLSINTIDPNNIFIGTTNGLAHFDSKLLSNVRSKPNVYIRSFSYANDTIIYGNPKYKEHEYKIPYTANNVKFTFSSPEYENVQNIMFSYQLNPFDDNWSSWTNSSMKEYTNLREGYYTMQVKTKNGYGVESDTRYLGFTISPPWYRHYMAYISYALVYVLIVYFISEWIKKRYRKKEYYKTVEQRKIYLEKESKIRKEQYNLEMEIEKLNQDKLQTKLIAKNKELVNNSLQVVKKNKILESIIQKLKRMEMDSASDTTKTQLNSLKKSIVKEIKSDHSWKDLEKHIKNVHFEFLKRLKEKYPTVTPRELDLATYLLLNMSTKEIAEVMNISKKGVELSRFRLRKKLGLQRKENLIGFLMNI